MLSLASRFFLYGAFGCCFEIVFTGIKGLFRSRFKDWTLEGKSYIWMFPIYGLAAFLFEPLHNSIRHWPWLVRGLIYVCGLYLVEFVTGFALKKLIGKCPWDYSTSKYNFKGLIRWEYAPVWFGFCMALEFVHDLLLRIRIE
jgi:uncharacterized membrane protein